jgi:hypothetical protein
MSDRKTTILLQTLQSPAQFISALDREIDALDQIIDRARAKTQLPACCWESPESSWGACDGGFPCYEPATVHELATGLEYCLEHFEEAL